MAKIITKCPSCGSPDLKVTKIQCGGCETKFEGAFEIPALMQLNEEELVFAVDFIRSSGSLKEIAAKYEVSYPTVRNRLNDLIRKIENAGQSLSIRRNEILSQLEAGKITATEAAKRLKEL